MERSKNLIIAVLVATVIFLLAERDWTDSKQAEPEAESFTNLAVLPFSPMADSDLSALAYQTSAQMIENLMHTPGVRIAARTSTWNLSADQASLRQALVEMGINYWVEGSLTGFGERIQISVQLVDAETGLNVWSETYARLVNDDFDPWDVPREAAAAIQMVLASTSMRTASTH